MMAGPSRPPVPDEYVERLDAILAEFPRCEFDPTAWTGARWRIGGATVAHVFGGHDQLFRLTFRATEDEVEAFQHMGDPYFVVGGNSVGILVDNATDWEEVREMLIDSYCVQAPQALAAQLDPGFPGAMS